MTAGFMRIGQPDPRLPDPVQPDPQGYGDLTYGVQIHDSQIHSQPIIETHPDRSMLPIATLPVKTLVFR